MQGKIIAEQILLDARANAENIYNEAKAQIDKERQEFLDFKSKEKELNQKRLDKKLEKMKADLNIKKNSEREKRLYKHQQSIIFDIKEQAKIAFSSLPEERKLKFVEDVLKKYSEEGEEVQCLGVSLEAVKGLNIVRKNKLKIIKGFEEGLILSSASTDKNFLITTLIDEAFEKCESEIFKLLF